MDAAKADPLDRIAKDDGVYFSKPFIKFFGNVLKRRIER